MKKLASLALALCMIFALAACGGESGTEATEDPRAGLTAYDSVLDEPAQRPERGSAPASTRWVHGSQPIDG